MTLIHNTNTPKRSTSKDVLAVIHEREDANALLAY